LGGKWEEVKKVFPSHSIDLQAKETSPSPSIGHQAWNIPFATKFWIYLHLPCPSLEKADLDHGELSLCPDIIFNSILNTYSHKFFEDEDKND
jgi:hypothetical protein